MASSSSSRSAAAGSHRLKDVVKRLREMKKNWTNDKEPDPGDPQFQSIVDELKELTYLTEMDFVGKNLTDVLIRVIGRAMQEIKFPSLKNLELGGNYISAKGIQAIADAMHVGNLPALESLELCRARTPDKRNSFLAWSRNQIEDEGLGYLVGAFREGHGVNLKVLNLELNRIGPAGAQDLALAIRGGHLPALEVLNLSFTTIGDEGTAAVAKAFEKCGQISHLKVLNLERCTIGVAGTKALASAINSGCLMDLQSLNLGANNTKLASHGSSLKSLAATSPADEGLVELAVVLQNGQLPRLQSLDLTGNAGGKKSSEAFRDALRNNSTLVLELKIDWQSFAPYANRVRKLTEQNRRTAHLLSQLRGEEDVPARNGKIFLCGNPRQGKTTLRKTLQKDLTFYSHVMPERTTLHQEDEPPTRGIEVSYIDSKGERGEPPVTIAIWDLAGQAEYQILHSAFLPDLALADGEATTFVVVCNSNYSKQSEEDLTYWMRFIASSSFKGEDGGKRHVLLVLNRFHNVHCEQLQNWTRFLKELHKKFHDYLEIKLEPFDTDVRVIRSVKPLKDHLIDVTRRRLQNKKVPKICEHIQKAILEPARTVEFPVIPWALFLSKLRSFVRDEEKLIAAADYLHESGRLIRFREGSLVEGVDPLRNLVVTNPDWFCRRVVGYLLLPTHLLDVDEIPLKQSLYPDGSLALSKLYSHFKQILHHKQDVLDIVAMLFRLGICYKVGEEKVLIPALIEKSEKPSGSWGQTKLLAVTDQWVMGYCLKVEYKETTLLPVAVFRRLQVDLSQDRLCSSGDSDYTVGKYFIHFKYNGMAAIVELSGNSEDQQDRVDILVKPLVNREHDTDNLEKTRRELQVDLAQLLIEKFVALANQWSPGVEFVRAVVQPWSTATGTLMVQHRVTMLVSEVKQRVQEDGLEATLTWTVGTDNDSAELVHAIDLLSGRELKGLTNSVEEQCANVEHMIVALGLIPDKQNSPSEDNSGELCEPSTSELNKLEVRSPEMDELYCLIFHLGKRIGGIGDKIDTLALHVDGRLDEIMKSMQDMRKHLGSALERQKSVLESLQALYRFSMKEKERSVPRFLYFTRANDPSGMWMKMKQKVMENATLHFLCEADCNNHGLHEVKDQEGIDFKNLKKWAKKIIPWAIWSLKVAIVVAKAASQVVLPGLAQLVQGFPSGSDGALDVAIADWVTAFVLEGEPLTENGGIAAPSIENSSPSRPVEVQEGLKEVLKKVLGELPPNTFLTKFKLRPVVLNKSEYVVWICNECYNQYNNSGSVQVVI